MRGRWLTVVIGCGFLIVASGCSPSHIDDSQSGGSTQESSPAGASATTLPLTQTPEYVASNTPCPRGLPELGAVPLSEAAPSRSVTLTPFLDLPEPTAMVFDSDGSGNGFVGDRRGRIWRFWGAETANDDVSTAARIAVEPAADFSSDTAAEHDQGLVGMTLGPRGRLWINRTDRTGASVVTVLTPTSDANALESGPTDMLRLDQPSAQHNGGALVFGPDGMLYVSFGDGGGLGDPRHHGQNLATPLGAVLRFEVDAAQSDATDDWRLRAAKGNPDLGARSDPRIWAYGARNSFSMSFDPMTGDLWIADVGQQCIEEVTVLAPSDGGANLGWNAWEGSRRFVGPDVSNHHLPDLEYRHGRGLCAVIGGHVYRGRRLDWLTGRYVFTDVCGAGVFAASVNSGRVPDDIWHLGVSSPRPVGVAVDTDGELYVIDIELGVLRLDG